MPSAGHTLICFSASSNMDIFRKEVFFSHVTVTGWEFPSPATDSNRSFSGCTVSLLMVLATVLGGGLEVEELSQVRSGCLTSDCPLTGVRTSGKSFAFSQLPFPSVQGLREALPGACWGDLMRMCLT